MPNMTITADEDTLRWARVKAAEEHTSVARLVGDLLKEKMRSTRAYATARRQHFELIQPVRFTGKRPKRDDLYDRRSLR
jgi:hypothetical protein